MLTAPWARADHFSGLRGKTTYPGTLAVPKVELNSTCHVSHCFLPSKEPAWPRADISRRIPLASGRRLQPSTAVRRALGPGGASKFPGGLLPPQDQTAWGFPESPRHPGNPPIWPHTNPVSSKSPQRAFEASTRHSEARTVPPERVLARLHLPSPTNPFAAPGRSRRLSVGSASSAGAGPLERLRVELGCFREWPLRTRHWAALAGSLAAAPQSAAAAAACGPGGWEKPSVGE